MIRNNGFINLDLLLKERGVDITNIETIKASPLVTSVFNSKKCLEINLDDQIYYYKVSNFVSPYNELLANELAKDFGIPYVEYDLAILNNRKGVISRNFRKKDAKYISGFELLLDENCNILKSNNLESIWDAVEHRYHNYPNKNEIVENIIKGIVSTFIFDIILCHNDRHPYNWEIEETKDSIGIAPVYDNEMILFERGKDVWLTLTVDGESHNIITNIETFMRISEESAVDMIRNNLWIIDRENLELIFRRIENKTNYPIPNNIKERYLIQYEEHKEQLIEILGNKNSFLERNDQNEGKSR